MGIMCEFNRRTGLQPTLLNDCDICKEKYRMPHDFCCLYECGEHEFCRNCTHGIHMSEKSYLEELVQTIQTLRTTQNPSNIYILLVHPDMKELVEKEVLLPGHIQIKASPFVEKLKAYFITGFDIAKGGDMTFAPHD